MNLCVQTVFSISLLAMPVVLWNLLKLMMVSKYVSFICNIFYRFFLFEIYSHYHFH